MSNFTEKHAEFWKFVKFIFAGVSSSAVELLVHMVLMRFVFASIKDVLIDNELLAAVGVNYKGVLYAFLISTAVGYTIAFIMNRKITFHANANPTLSIALYVVMVLLTIFATAWLGSVLTVLAVNRGLYDTRLGGAVDSLIKVAVMLAATAWTYPLNRFVIHRKRKVLA